MRRSGLLAAGLGLLLVAAAFPASVMAGSPTTAECTGYESAGEWDRAARCWEEEQAAWEAQINAEIREQEEREAAAKARHEEERHEREREARAERRQRQREHARLQREWAHKPTVTLAIAKEFARRALAHSQYDVWTVNCGGGRLDRTHWRCGATVYYGYCYATRIRVTGVGFKNHRPWYHARSGEFRPC